MIMTVVVRNDSGEDCLVIYVMAYIHTLWEGN